MHGETVKLVYWFVTQFTQIIYIKPKFVSRRQQAHKQLQRPTG